MRRRSLLLGGLGTGVLAAAGALALRPGDNGQPHDAYFRGLQTELKRQGLMRPCMVIDLDRLDHNIAEVTQSVARGGKHLRLVEKSLPSPRLLDYISRQAGTRRLMSFHQPFLNHDVLDMPDADILLGKPMPVAMAATFYRDLRGAFDPARQLQWLVDTPARLREYLALAQGLGTRMNINIELDVGLHRGGVPADEAGGRVLAALLEIIAAHPRELAFSGFMGYEPHVVMLPGLLGSPDELLAQAMAVYQRRVDQLRRTLPELWPALPQAPGHDGARGLTFNTAGSPTYRLHERERLSNDISVGTGLLKPSHYDLPTLATHQPAVFISTPVLKTTGPVRLPGLDDASRLFSWWDVNQRETLFIYGGNWLADPVSPAGLQANGLYGRSSNQEIVNISPSAGVRVDDLVFLRPTQSEAVLLQFGDLVVVRGGKVVDTWPVFS